MGVLSEVGDFSRFESAEKFASYLGLVPGREFEWWIQKYAVPDKGRKQSCPHFTD